MGSSAEKLWAAFIKDVQYIVQNTAAAEGSETIAVSVATAVNAFSKHVRKLDQQPSYSHAAWKRLIFELKISLKLSTLCKEAQLQHPKSAAVHYSTMALNLFQRKGSLEGAVQPGTQLCATSLRQVQQSGLLQHLAGMMTDAADELERYPETVAAEFGAEKYTAGVNALGSISSVSPRRLSSLYQQSVCNHTDHLLAVLGNICKMFSNSTTHLSTVPAAVYAAALRLATTGLQGVSAALPHVVQQQQKQTLLYQEVLAQMQQHKPDLNIQVQSTTPWLTEVECCFTTTRWLLDFLATSLYNAGLAGVPIEEVPLIRPLLLSPCLLPALAAMVATSVLAAVGAHGSSGSGSGSSSSSSSVGSVWQPPKQLQLELSPAQLQLCDVLGVSGQTLLWAARCIADKEVRRIRPMQVFTGAYSSTAGSYARKATEIPPQLVLQVVRLDLLLPSFVLRWLDSIPASQRGWKGCCQLVSQCSGLGFAMICGESFETMSAPDILSVQERQEHDAALIALLRQRQQPPSVVLLAEVLPVVVRLCTAVLQQTDSDPSTTDAHDQSGRATTPKKQKGNAARNAGAASGSSSSSSSGGGGEYDILPLSPQESAQAGRKALHNWVMLLYSLLYGCLAKTAPSSSSSSSNGQVLRVEQRHLQSLGQHAVSLLTVLEGIARGDPTDTLLTICLASLCRVELEGSPGVLPGLVQGVGPGSQAQLNMYSLLCSLLKISGNGALGIEQVHCSSLRRAAAEAAVMLLVAPTLPAMLALCNAHDPLMPDEESIIAAAATKSFEVKVAAAANAAAAAAAATKALDVLPSLVILGRCLLQWAQQLQAEVPFLVQQSADGLERYFEQDLLEGIHMASAMCCYKGAFSLVEYLLLVVRSWLQARSHSAELAAAGYAPQPLLHQLDQLLAAIRGAQSSNSSSETPSAAAYTAVVEQLQSTGLALCALAVPCMCNYPGCTNLSGLTELGTVSGRSCMCGSCRVAHYCSRACQKRHWKQHKPVCAALAGGR